MYKLVGTESVQSFPHSGVGERCHNARNRAVVLEIVASTGFWPSDEKSEIVVLTAVSKLVGTKSGQSFTHSGVGERSRNARFRAFLQRMVASIGFWPLDEKSEIVILSVVGKIVEECSSVLSPALWWGWTLGLRAISRVSAEIGR